MHFEISVAAGAVFPMHTIFSSFLIFGMSSQEICTRRLLPNKNYQFKITCMFRAMAPRSVAMPGVKCCVLWHLKLKHDNGTRKTKWFGTHDILQT